MSWQQILQIGTEGNGLRSKAIGWTLEDSSVVYLGLMSASAARQMNFDWKKVPIGFARSHASGAYYSYDTVMHALADQWHLLAPPQKEVDGTWTWWLVKEST